MTWSHRLVMTSRQLAMTSPQRLCRGVRKRVMLLRVLIVLLLIAITPPLRNRLFFVPVAWHNLSLNQILTVQYYTEAGTTRAMLRPCTLDKDAMSSNSLPVMNLTMKYLALDSSMAQNHAMISRKGNPKDQTLYFVPIMSKEDKARLMILWQVLDNVFKRWRIEHFFLAGSLLGAVRHHGMIPWDDDIDIGVWEKDSIYVQHALSCLWGYSLRVKDAYHYKFFSSRAPVVREIPPFSKLYADNVTFNYTKSLQWHEDSEVAMRFPFIDIFVMRKAGSIAFPIKKYESYYYVFPIDMLEPVKRVEFDGFMVPVPHDMVGLVNMEYPDADLCRSPMNIHRWDQFIPDHIAIPCSELYHMYPFYPFE